MSTIPAAGGALRLSKTRGDMVNLHSTAHWLSLHPHPQQLPLLSWCLISLVLFVVVCHPVLSTFFCISLPEDWIVIKNNSTFILDILAVSTSYYSSFTTKGAKGTFPCCLLQSSCTSDATQLMSFGQGWCLHSWVVKGRWCIVLEGKLHVLIEIN